jgi:hypothetical protein
MNFFTDLEEESRERAWFSMEQDCRVVAVLLIISFKYGTSPVPTPPSVLIFVQCGHYGISDYSCQGTYSRPDVPVGNILAEECSSEVYVLIVSPES